MATSVLRTPSLRVHSLPRLSTNSSFNSPKFMCVSLTRRPRRCHIHYAPNSSHKISRPLLDFLPFASQGEAIETDEKEEIQESQLQDNSDEAAGVEDIASEGDNSDADEPASAILAALESYKEALASNNEAKVAEIEALLKSIEDEKIVLEGKVATLCEELSNEKVRILRISADFDNFRKRTDRERLSLVENAQGEVTEKLLPILDNFERAKAQIKVETEGEEKISNSYQSIYKQFLEILGSLGVVTVETIGNPFDPLLHEAIMREDSAEFEEGIILQEFRKGFKLGDRLLRPSMVKVSAGPGPAKPEQAVPPEEEPEVVSETSEEAPSAADS